MDPPEESKMTGHKFKAGDVVTVASGNIYRIYRPRFDDHRKFKGEPGYGALQLRNGVEYGPFRLFRESAIVALVVPEAAS
jgi:hypothetical protein